MPKQAYIDKNFNSQTISNVQGLTGSNNQVYEVTDITARDAIASLAVADIAKVTDDGTGSPRDYVWNGSAWIAFVASSSNASAIAVAATPTNYSPPAANVEDHLSAIDLALASSGGGSGGNSGSTLLKGLAAYWSLNETTGTRADSTGNGNSLLDINSVGTRSGINGNEAVFVRANNNGLVRPDLAYDVFQTDQSFTFSAWITLDNLSNNQTIAGIYRSTGGDARKWLLQYDLSNNQLRLLLSPDGSAATNVPDTIAPVIGQRYFIVVSYDYDSNLASFYRDGTLIASANPTTPGLFTIPDSNTVFGLGTRSGSTDDFDGAIDEAAYWSRALTQSEIDQLYNSGSGYFYGNW